MTQTNFRILEPTFIDKRMALNSEIEWNFLKGSTTRLGKSKGMGLASVKEGAGPDAELFALAEQVDLAEKAFHGALARRNDAQIAFLREPSIIARKTFEATKISEEAAHQILDTEVQRLAGIRAATIIELKLKASYASTEGKLRDSIVEDILQL